MPAGTRAEVTTYLVNVTVRPGYNFANADAALGYGHDLCDRVAQGRVYAHVTGDTKADRRYRRPISDVVSAQPGGQ